MRRDAIDAPRRGRPHMVPTWPWTSTNAPVLVGGTSADAVRGSSEASDNVAQAHRGAKAGSATQGADKALDVSQCAAGIGGTSADVAAKGPSEAAVNAVRVHRCAKVRSAALGADMALEVDRCATASQRHWRRCGNMKSLKSHSQCGVD